MKINNNVIIPLDSDVQEEQSIILSLYDKYKMLKITSISNHEGSYRIMNSIL